MMRIENEKRSSRRENARRCSRTAELFDGVGGRQASAHPPAGGGGYQNICTVFNFHLDGEQKKRDPRLEELREMGLRRVLQDIAAAIGVDNTLKMWRIIDASETRLGDDGEIRLPFPRYKSYLRYQRNRYIETLVGLGHSITTIRELLNKQLGERLSKRQLSRVVKNLKDRDARG